MGLVGQNSPAQVENALTTRVQSIFEAIFETIRMERPTVLMGFQAILWKSL